MVEVVERGEERDTQITYITEKALRIEFPKTGTVVILRVKGKGIEAHTLNLRDKTYTDISSMASTFGTAYLALFVRCDNGGRKCEVDRSVLKPTDEYRTINGHRARKVIYYLRNLKGLLATMGQAMPDSVEGWLVKDWKALYRAEMVRLNFLNEFTKRTLNSPESRAILTDLTPFLKGILKKYGAPIVTFTPFGGSLTKVTRVSVKRLEIPSEKFRVPEGFRRQ